MMDALAGAVQTSPSEARPYSRRQALAVVAAMVLVTLVLGLVAMPMNVMVDPIRKTLQISDLQINLLLGAAGAAPFVLMRLVGGWLSDRLSRRRLLVAAVISWTLGPGRPRPGGGAGPGGDGGRVRQPALVETAGVKIVLATLRTQAFGTDLFSGLGVDLRQQRIVVVKSSQHFHAAYAPIASSVVYVDAPGSCSGRLDALVYRKIQRPKWPLDAV
jgi:MFS family permease